MPTLDWFNKKEALETADNTPYKVLVENKELSYGDQTQGNMLIKGDNLEALKALLPYYKGRVKCIYIDPPYNTGSAFEHYDDNLEHSTWLSLMYPRLELLKDLLSPDGLIFVQIDDNEFAYLQAIMDELFGRSRHLNTICVKMSESSGVKMSHTDKRLPKLKEYILVYFKDKAPRISVEKVPVETWNPEYKSILTGLSESEIDKIHELINKDCVEDQDIEYCNSVLKKGKIKSLVAYFEEQKIPTSKQEQWKFEHAKYIIQAVGSSSVFNLAKSNQLLKQDIMALKSAEGLLYLIKTDIDFQAKQPRVQIVFAEENLMRNPGDLWLDIKTTGGVGQEGGIIFPNGKKPEKLIRKIITMGTNKGDIVMDSFLGSGTTAAVAQKMGRKFIGIEMGEHAITHCVPRLKQVTDGTDQSGISKSVNWTGGSGFTFYDLGKTIFNESGNINQGIAFKDLAFHVWFSETKNPMQDYKYSPLLGVHKDTAYYLLYNGVLGDKRVNGGNVLTSKVLESLPPFNGPKVIYGESCRLSPERLKKENIIFKQTPYEITAR